MTCEGRKRQVRHSAARNNHMMIMMPAAMFNFEWAWKDYYVVSEWKHARGVMTPLTLHAHHKSPCRTFINIDIEFNQKR